jgi:hypothetical protein
MKTSKTKEQAKIIIEKSIAAFGLPQNMKTDPQIMKSVIEELKLDDFRTKNKLMNKLFKDIISKPQKLQPMFDNIKKGLLSKHPAIIEFSDLALKENWFKPSDHIIRSVHVMYILEVLTATMCNNHDFFIEVQDHYKNNERKLGLNTRYIFRTLIQALGISRNLFIIVKAYTLDPLMIYFKIQRGLSKSHLTKKELDELYKNNDINYIEYKVLSPIHKNGREHINELIRINIYEAGITEYKNNLKINAISAYELSEDIKNNPPSTIFKRKSVIPEKNTDPFYASITKKENLFSSIKFNQDWISLYVTWNMAFVLGNLKNVDIIFPKLLIPSVINAESDNFMGARIISLWMTINHDIFRHYEKTEFLGPTNKTEMAIAWSKINKKYAFDLANRETHEDSKTLMKNYNRFFLHPIWNLLKLLTRYS